MKYLTSRAVKVIVAALTLINSVVFIKLLGVIPWPETLLGFLTFEALVIIFYIIHVASVVWAQENTETLRNSINRLESPIYKINNDLAVLNATFAKSEAKLREETLALNVTVEKIRKEAIGQSEMLFVLSQEIDQIKTSLRNIRKEQADYQSLLRESITGMKHILEETGKQLIDSIAQNEVNLGKRIVEKMEQTESGLQKEIKDLVSELQRNWKEAEERLEKELKEAEKELEKELKEAEGKLEKELKEIHLNTRSRFGEFSSDLRQLITNAESKINSEIQNEGKKLTRLSEGLKQQLYYNYNRIDALFSIYKLINIRSPLPIMHDWAISSDYAHFLLKNILHKGEGNVVDIGSGISTILAGYAIEKNGTGKVISLEHDLAYVEKTRQLISEHKLSKVVELYHCPLVNYEINGETWVWYDISRILNIENVSIVSVDGPPGNLQHQSRYPAVPLLKKYLSNNTTIILDDGGREEESKIAGRWESEYNLTAEFNSGFKGFYKFEFLNSNGA